MTKRQQEHLDAWVESVEREERDLDAFERIWRASAFALGEALLDAYRLENAEHFDLYRMNND